MAERHESWPAAAPRAYSLPQGQAVPAGPAAPHAHPGPPGPAGPFAPAVLPGPPQPFAPAVPPGPPQPFAGSVPQGQAAFGPPGQMEHAGPQMYAGPRGQTGPFGPPGPQGQAATQGRPGMPGQAGPAMRPPSGLFPGLPPRPVYREPHPVRTGQVFAGLAATVVWFALFGALARDLASYAWWTVVAAITAWLVSIVLAVFGDRGVAIAIALVSGFGLSIAMAFVAGRWIATDNWPLW